MLKYFISKKKTVIAIHKKICKIQKKYVKNRFNLHFYSNNYN